MAATLPPIVGAQVERILGNMPDAFLVVAADGRLLYLNPHAAELFRCSAATAPDTSLWELLPALEETRLGRELRKPGESEASSAFEEQIPDLGGWFRVQVYRLVDSVAVQLQDITERKRAEEALRASEAKFGGIVSIAPDAIVAVDESQQIILFNSGAETIFGYRAEEVMGKPLDLLIPDAARPTHRRHVGEFARSPVEARRMGERGEVSGRRKNGDVFPAEASISKLDLGGRRIFTAVLRDVTDRKRAEQELRLLQSLTLGITEAQDLPDAFAVTLEHVCRVIGWVYGEVWTPAADGVHLELAPGFYAVTPQLAAFHEASRTFTFSPGKGLVGQVWERGEPVWVRDITRQPYYVRTELATWAGLRTALAIPALADERVVAVLALYHYAAGEEDARLVQLVSAVAAQLGVVIRAKQTAGALERQAEELARSNAELEQFASVASHDLQEPLRKILAFGERVLSLHGEALPEDGQEYLRRMQDAAARMQLLIQDLLTFSRVTTQAQPFVPVSLEAVAREVVSDLDTMLEEAGGQVEIGSLPLVEADPLQMRQLLQNLLSNAIKFHPPGEPPRVRVHAAVVPAGHPLASGTAAETDSCELYVEDRGIGFDERYLDRIFGVFQRLHGRGRYPGTGMGLAICRKIVDRHGGTITARSAPGAGSTFVVTLPLARDASRDVNA